MTKTPLEADKVLYEKTIEVRWADCDANRHMRHSAYSDLCGHTRVGFMDSIGMTSEFCEQQGFGPVLFKEETEYRREVHINEVLRVTVEVGEATGFSKSVQMVQHIYKPCGTLAAIHRCVIGFMDMVERKIVALPEAFITRFPVSSEPR